MPYIISDELHLRKVCKNLDSDKIRITLTHINKWVNNEFDVKLEELRSSKLFDILIKKGVMVYEYCSCQLSDYLFGQVQAYIDKYGYKYEHYRLGWGKSGRTSGFFASKSISAPYLSSIWNDEENCLGPNGDRVLYDDMVAKQIIPYQSMHLPFVLGFTAPIVPLINKKSDVPVLLVNFAGKSSMGKTTSMKLIASIWGRGTVSNKRLSVCKTWSCTENGFEAAVNANMGIPALFDDFQNATKQANFSDLIYRLAQGESKIRCNKNGKLVDTYSWSTLIAFTGEHNIFDYVTNDSGIKARIVQFQNVQWTASEQNVVEINSVIKDNYGFYGEEFVEKLLTKSDDELFKYYEESKAVISKALPTTDNVNKRLQNRYAIIRMTAVLVKELINNGIDVDYITDFLVNVEKKREEQLTLFEEAKEILIEYINKNFTRFVRKGEYNQYVIVPNNQTVGRIYTGKQGNMVAILPDEFKKIMLKFGDHDLILETWRKDGFLITESETRFTKKVRISAQVVAPRCYVFLFQNFDDLFGKLLKAEEISVENIEEEDLINEYKMDPKRVKTRITGYGKNKERHKYVELPDEPITEIKNRFQKEYHTEYVEAYDSTQSVVFQEPESPFNSDLDFNDDAEIDAIFAEGDSDEDC